MKTLFCPQPSDVMFPSQRARNNAIRLTAQGRWGEANQAWLRLLSANGARPSDHVKFAQAVEKHEGLEAAAKPFQTAASRFPLDSNVHRQHALHLLRRHRDEDACLAFARARALSPRDEVLREDLARLWIDPPRERQLGIQAFRDRPAPSPAPEGRVARMFARSALKEAGKASRAGDWARSGQAYRKVLKRRPTYLHGYLRLGHVLKEAGDLPGAEAAYWRAVGLSLRQAEPFLHLGHVLKMQGEYESSLAAYLVAWTIEPANADVMAELKGQGYAVGDLAQLVEQRWGQGGAVGSEAAPVTDRPAEPGQGGAPPKLLLRPPLQTTLKEKAVKADIARALAMGDLVR